MASLATITPSVNAGALLRQWRIARRVSQLTLALDAGISMRHLSYVETGRSQPSREMVIRLADALEVPLRERNTLLLAAGYAPLYRETGLDAAELAEMRRAVDLILAHHEPFPAVVLDRHWNLVMANAATLHFLARFLPPCAAPGPRNALRLMFDPDGLRPFVENWDEVAEGLIQRVHREAAVNPWDPCTTALLNELLGYPGVPSHWGAHDSQRTATPLLVARYRHDGQRLSFFSTITTFGTPQDVTMQELRIECFFPADEETRAALTPS